MTQTPVLNQVPGIRGEAQLAASSTPELALGRSNLQGRTRPRFRLRATAIASAIGSILLLWQFPISDAPPARDVQSQVYATYEIDLTCTQSCARWHEREWLSGFVPDAALERRLVAAGWARARAVANLTPAFEREDGFVSTQRATSN
jgi:hypothetical protein